MLTWGVAAILMIVTWVVLAGVPGAPIKGTNRIVLGVGSLIIIAAYILLSQGPASNPLSLTWAPMLLVAGYCVLLPISLLRRQGPDRPQQQTSQRTPQRKR